MAESVVIEFTCPTCHVGFQVYLSLPEDQPVEVMAACGNKHVRLVPMDRTVSRNTRGKRDATPTVEDRTPAGAGS